MLVSIMCKVDGLKAIYTNNPHNAYFAFVDEARKNISSQRIPQGFLSKFNLSQCEGDEKVTLDEKFVTSYRARPGGPIILSNKELILRIADFMATKIPERRVPVVQIY